MSCDRIENACELYCFKVVRQDGKVVYYVDTSMEDAARSANEIMPVKSIEEIGDGMVGC